jgi:hypothetical protein
MGGQGFIPEDGEGGLVEGAKEAKKLEQQPGAPLASAKGAAKGAAPRAGMQGAKERGAAPTTILPRPGTTPEKGGRTDVHRTTEQSANRTGTGEGVDTGE